MSLSLSAFEKLRRLRTTFDRNYRLTQLYAEYLTRYPKLLDRETVEAIATDGTTKEEAIAALLSTALLPEIDTDPEARVLERDYLIPSVKILDAERYRRDPYFRAVKIENRKMGDWELRWETYEPYQAVIASDMHTDNGFREYPTLGFFTESFSFPAVLEGGNEWMTLTPVDMDTCTDAIDAAHGKVVTFGLGLGYFAFMAARKPEVSSVTVIEKSPDVIRLFEEVLLPQFPCRDKIRVICADAFEYAECDMPAEHYDYAFVDTWRDASDGYPMYRRMKPLEALNPDTVFSYWIEGFLLSRMRSLLFEEIWERESADKTHKGPEATDSFDTVSDRLSDEGLRKIAKTSEK